MVVINRGLGSLFDILDPLNPQYTLPTLAKGEHIPAPTQEQLNTLSSDELMTALANEGWSNYVGGLQSDASKAPNLVTVNPYGVINDVTGSVVGATASEVGNAISNFSLPTWVTIGGVAVAAYFGLKLLKEI